MNRLKEAERLLERLLEWEANVFGGSEASVWEDARNFLDERPDAFVRTFDNLYTDYEEKEDDNE